FSNPAGLGNPPVVPAALSGGSSSTGLGSSGAGGLKPLSTGGGFGGLPSPPSQGLSSAGFLAGGSSLAPPSSAMPPPASPAVFSRGLSTGLGNAGGPAAPFAPPVSPASTAAGSVGPAGAAPVAAAGGPGVSSSSAPMAASAGPAAGSAG